MDERWGRGGWRPIPRFLVVQADWKQRACDDGARGGHNATTVVHYKMVLRSAAQPAITAEEVRNAAQEMKANVQAEGFSLERARTTSPMFTAMRQSILFSSMCTCLR